MWKEDSGNTIQQLLSSPKTKQKGMVLLIDIYQEQLYWHIRKMLINHDNSKDVLQEVFLRVWKNIDQFKGESKLSTWLYRIASNEALRFLERRKRLDKDRLGIEAILVAELESSPYIDGDEVQLNLQKAIMKLPATQRLVFNLRYFDEMNYEDIAQIVETTINSVKVSFHHAKTRIEEIIRNEVYD